VTAATAVAPVLRDNQRVRVTGRAAAAILAAGIALGCAGCGQPAVGPAGRAGTGSCWQSAVRAIQRHVVIRSVPRSCAGLTGAELGAVVAWAVRAAGGPHAKAAQRRIAAADSRYLASLVRASASRAATPAAPPAPAGAAPAPGAGSGAPAGGRDAGLGLAALGCWAATAAAGGYLFRSHRRPAGRPGRLPAIAAAHASVALAGLALCAAAAAVHSSAALAWIAAALVIGTAGLGMAVLLTAATEPAAVPERAAAASAQPTAATRVRAGPAPRRVLAIASHVALAVATMLLVLLAATGRS
jgi:hypothetical protein